MKEYSALILLVVMMVMTSCSSKSSFGYLNEKYSKSRLANFNEEYNPFYKEERTREENTYARTNRNRTSTKSKRVSKKTVVSANVTSPSKVDAVALKRQDVVRHARMFVGVPYKYGGKRPDKGFDCSGFTSFVMEAKEVDLSGPSHSQAVQGVQKYRSDLEPGDLLFFGKKGKVSHVGMVERVEGGNVYMIHASTSAGVRIDNITHSDYWGSRYLYARDVISPNGALARGI